MAVNKESNSFTFGFAIALVIVIGVVLAALSEGLKPYKEKNVRVKKQLDILSAMMDVEKEGITRENAEVEFKKYVTKYFWSFRAYLTTLPFLRSIP